MNLSELLNQAPNYNHLGLENKKITIEISAEEQEIILTACDRGIEFLNSEKKHLLEKVLFSLKDEIYP